jgi:hypothetical protein
VLFPQLVCCFVENELHQVRLLVVPIPSSLDRIGVDALRYRPRSYFTDMSNRPVSTKLSPVAEIDTSTDTSTGTICIGVPHSPQNFAPDFAAFMSPHLLHGGILDSCSVEECSATSLSAVYPLGVLIGTSINTSTGLSFLSVFFACHWRNSVPPAYVSTGIAKSTTVSPR